MPQSKPQHPYQRGDHVDHANRGKCIFLEVDEADPSGETVWVKIIEEDVDAMVSRCWLTPGWPPEKEE
jgi:hypothetical protein